MELRKYDRKTTFGVTYDCGPTVSSKRAPCGEEQEVNYCKPPFLCRERLKYPDCLVKIDGFRDYIPMIVKSCKEESEYRHPCDPKPRCDDEEYIKNKAAKTTCPKPAICIHRLRHPVNAETVDDECDDGSGFQAVTKIPKQLPKCKACVKKDSKRSPIRKEKHR